MKTQGHTINVEQYPAIKDNNVMTIKRTSKKSQKISNSVHKQTPNINQKIRLVQRVRKTKRDKLKDIPRWAIEEE